MKITSLLAPVIGLCMATESIQAATIIFTFDNPTAAMNGSNTGQTATQSASVNDFGSGISVSDYSAVSPTGGIAVVGGQMRALKKSDTDTHTFTVTIPAGLNISFSSLAFDYGTVGADTAPANFLVSSNFAGGTFTPNTATHAAVANTSASADMDLGGSFTNILSASPTVITFTLADSAGGNNNSTAMYTWIDNVTLTGTVIPEPSAAFLGGIGMLCLLRRRR